MKTPDQQLLEEAYGQVCLTESFIRNNLLQNGYTKEQIDWLIKEGILDKIKQAGSGLARTAKRAALPAVVAAGMLASGQQASAQDSSSQQNINNVQKATTELKSQINTQSRLMDVSNQADQMWQKQNFDGLKKLRNDLKNTFGIKSNQEFDKLVKETPGTESGGNFSGLNLLTTQRIGN
jgi:hypothetical protein